MIHSGLFTCLGRRKPVLPFLFFLLGLMYSSGKIIRKKTILKFLVFIKKKIDMRLLVLINVIILRPLLLWCVLIDSFHQSVIKYDQKTTYQYYQFKFDSSLQDYQ